MSTVSSPSSPVSTSVTEAAPRSPGFFRAFVLPSFWIFLIPILTFAFFLHARGKMDLVIRDSILQQIDADAEIAPDEKKQAKELWSSIPIWRLIERPEMQDLFADSTKSDYRQFRWMIRLSVLSVLVTLLTMMMIGTCVAFSLTSQRVQYYSLLIGWNGLRMVGIFQAIAQGLMLFALSYWVTALWFNVFVPKLMILVGIVVGAGIFVVAKAFFTRVSNDCVVDGFPIDASIARPLWLRLQSLCAALETNAPDQVIAGVDNNFFVTEHPVIANGSTFKGRTLFVSLPLLKQLSGSEADAVLAHEMAHFSGSDTLYSKKISPLLARYRNYLTALQQGGATLPVFYFMNLFRALFQLSLGKLGKEREFRADRLAAEQTSPNDLASALLKVIAYSAYREKVQNELFQNEGLLSEVNIGERVESEFKDFAADFMNPASRIAGGIGIASVGNLTTTHPFDSHPSMAARAQALGVDLDRQGPDMLRRPSDGKWYHEIERADELERAQWDEYEEEFRKAHEETLPFRFLPSNDAEREVVHCVFPDQTFQDKNGKLVIDYEKVKHDTWDHPVFFRDMTNLSIYEGVVTIQYQSEGAKKKQTIKSSGYKKQANEMLGILQFYYQRYTTALAYQNRKSPAMQ
jgi:Zn-dependent protease with chaperone function